MLIIIIITVIPLPLLRKLHPYNHSTKHVQHIATSEVVSTGCDSVYHSYSSFLLLGLCLCRAVCLGRAMVRCRSTRSRSVLAHLHVVAAMPPCDRKRSRHSTELDLRALCYEIGQKMHFLGGLAVGVTGEGLDVVGSRREEHGDCRVYNVVLQMAHASDLTIAALRSACASTLQGKLLDAGPGEGRLATIPVAVRVLTLNETS
ncbi:unnamed protein product [Trypanosoma congolense IL3000]|uniref:WGS project CAEQ00000000 data, annotated contig 620 n=1 Tax=Trypanosoma congolense (strain IL3000) TaxID=1068625 RepID=F9WHA5_TRYCI|nr:unnamed protein product [Trypanosoma congolense IL3000]